MRTRVSLQIILRTVVKFERELFAIIVVTHSLGTIWFLSENQSFIVLYAQIVRMRKIHMLTFYLLHFAAPDPVLRGGLGRIRIYKVIDRRPVVGHRHHFIILGRRRRNHLVEFALLVEPVASIEACCKMRFLRYLLFIPQVSYVGIILLIEPWWSHYYLTLRVLMPYLFETCKFGPIHGLNSKMG